MPVTHDGVQAGAAGDWPAMPRTAIRDSAEPRSRGQAEAGRARLASRVEMSRCGWKPRERKNASASPGFSPKLHSSPLRGRRCCHSSKPARSLLQRPSAPEHANSTAAGRPVLPAGQIARTRRISVVAAVVPPTLLPTSHPDRSRQECRCEACESLGLPGAPGGVIIPPAVWRNRPVGHAPPSVQRDDPDLGVKTSIENDS